MLWLIVKYSLAAIGAYLLISLWVERFGALTALWLLVFPLAYGLYEGWARVTK